MPAMSVYRILEFLEDQHLVHKLNLANKYVACMHISCDHAHAVPQFLICRNCSKVKEISINQTTISALSETVKSAGYNLFSPQVELNCLCESCA
jgi:Fur family zinc uptake transcriptional regulator